MDMMLNDLFGELDDDEDNDDEGDERLEKDVVDQLVDEILLGMSFEVHRACKLGTYHLDEMDVDAQLQYEIRDIRGLDVFGQVPTRKQYDCICPNCQRNLAASRFAPHLEKCMGMGRNSSRIASRRIANSGKRDSDNDSDYGDDEWSYTPEKKAKKVKKEKLKKSRSKNSKSTGDLPSLNSEGNGSLAYEVMTHDERKAILVHTCGVISEHTKKMCTRSIRCPQHTDDQRHAVRLYLLTQQGILVDEDHVIDIDTYDDSVSQTLRDTLHWDGVSNPSPADSTSTTNSNSSKKKKASKHSVSRSSKKKNHHGNHERITPTKLFSEFD